MPLVAKNLGNTGSTQGNRLVWHFITTGINALPTPHEIGSALDLSLVAATLPNAHAQSMSAPTPTVVTFRKILYAQLFHNADGDTVDGARLAFSRDGIVASPAATLAIGPTFGSTGGGIHDFSNLGGLKLFDTSNNEILFSNRTTAVIEAEIAADTLAGVPVRAMHEYNTVRALGPTTLVDVAQVGLIVEFRI